MDYIYRIVIGDWSNDGHGRSDEFIFTCSHDKKAIIKAYKKATKASGIALHEETFGKTKNGARAILCEYEQRTIDADDVQSLKDIGCKFEWRENQFEDPDTGKCNETVTHGDLSCGPHDVMHLFLEMVCLSRRHLAR